MYNPVKPDHQSLTIELSERCNLNCVHCYINLAEGDRQARSKELPTASWREILADAYAIGCRHIRITGGEPLVRPDFLSLYTIAHKMGFSVSILTNATLINQQVIRRFQEYPPSQIDVSVYGWDKFSYEQHTRTIDSFHCFLSGVDLLTNACLPVKFRIPPSKNLIMHRNMIRCFTETLSPFAEVEIGWYLSKRARTDIDESRRILEYRLSPDEAVDIILETDIISKKGTPRLLEMPRKLPVKLFACRAGVALSIDAYGQLQLCTEMRYPRTLYNLRKHTIRDALSSHIPQMKSLVVTNPEYLRRCVNCKIRLVCYQCPACSWTENANLDSPVDYLCRVAHTLANRIGLLHGTGDW
jgi:radical SAM protein with 4Fe4S-binding SPASM domain